MSDSNTLDSLKQLLDEELARETASPAKPAPKAPTVTWEEVQGPKPFQESLIWDWQREFFAAAGPEAWRQGIVPHYITSSSFAARAYAQVVAGHQLDRALAGETAPLTIMELGGGSGQFTFHFLKHYGELITPLLPPLRYLFTDVVQENLDFVRQHPLMQHFVELGVLEVALFDVMNPQPLELQIEEMQWLTEPQSEPLVVLANYVWDTVPMERWRVREGETYPLDVSLWLPQNGEAADYRRLPELQLRYQEGAAVQAPHPLIQQYAEHMPDCEVLLPKAGLQCLDWLAERTQGHLMLLSGDKPQGAVQAGDDPGRLVHHGSFSLSVNFEAFHWWARQQQGQALVPQRQHRSLYVGLYTAAAVVVGPYLEQAVQQWLKDFHPGDQFVLKRAIEQRYDLLTFDEVMAYVRFSHYDPKALRRGIPTLMALASGITDRQVQELTELMIWVWDNYYPMGEEPDLAFLIGSLFYELDAFEQALMFFDHSVALYGPDEGTMANIKSCKEMLGLD